MWRIAIMRDWLKLFFPVLLCFNSVVSGETDANDFQILDAFRKGLENPELLKWPGDEEDPCGSKWLHVVCSGNRVTQIQVAELGLKGPLPQNFNQLSMLYNVGLQRNNFTGKLPSFSGLSGLQYAYLGNNQFDMIPSDFFDGLDSLQVLSLEYNPINQSTGWALPAALANSAQLTNLSLSGCNLAGAMPDFLGGMSSLSALELSYNNLTGEIPASFANSGLQILWLNNQFGTKLTGPIDIVASMVSLTDAWLHGNEFSGTIPAGITACASLRRIWLNNNQLVGLVPGNLTTMPQLQSLRLENNKLMGPIPKLQIRSYTYSYNSFCQSTPGVPCSPEVFALLDFLGAVNYPLELAASWSGNNPCSGAWLGVSCTLGGKVSRINLPNRKLNGFISPSIGKLDSLMTIVLGDNNLSASIPANLTSLKLLRMLNLTANNLAPPVPNFNRSVKLLIDENPLLGPHPPSPHNGSPPHIPSSPPAIPPSPPHIPSSPPGIPPSPPGIPLSRPSIPPSPPNDGGSNSSRSSGTHSKGSKLLKVLVIVVSVVVGILILSLVALFVSCRQKEKKGAIVAPSSTVVHPGDPSDLENMVKIVVTDNSNKCTTASDLHSINSNGTNKAHLIESGNLVVSVQILRDVTRNFTPENELGRGGFGVVYKGELHDGTMIAVKRMEAAVVSNKALDEFQSEIAVLSKVRHRNLVSLLGYSVEGNERLLVYEYMPQGALSKHLFQWEKFNLEPLSWKKRLNIVLDVARGLEYLHNLAHQCFIHRDLKSSNILLGEDYRAKVADFGLVKLAPDGKNSVVTRLAGTFGYLAPEYAVTGKITTKADVFSFGVVLMELVTGLMALDEDRPEESRYLASWFCHMKSSKEKLMAIIDPSLDVTEETFESISIIAELAGHCAAREPLQRPDMGHAVGVLAPLVEKWKPVEDDQEECFGIDLRQPLLQMVKGWQASDGSIVGSAGLLDDSTGSIPARPAGFAESFTSADGR